MKRIVVMAAAAALAATMYGQQTPSYVSSTPARSQLVKQPIGTSLNVNVLNNRVSACTYPGSTADVQIGNAFAALPSSQGTVDGTCYGTSTQTLGATITLASGQNLVLSHSTRFVPASATSNVVNMSSGSSLLGLNVSLAAYPATYSAAAIEQDCPAGGTSTITLHNLYVGSAAGAPGQALLLNCNQTSTSGIVSDEIDQVRVLGLINPIKLNTGGIAWINGNTISNLQLFLPSTTPGTGIIFADDGLEIRGNSIQGFIEGDSVSGSVGIAYSGAGGAGGGISANIYSGSIFDTTTAFSPGTSTYGNNFFNGNFDGGIGDLKSTVFELSSGGGLTNLPNFLVRNTWTSASQGGTLQWDNDGNGEMDFVNFHRLGTGGFCWYDATDGVAVGAPTMCVTPSGVLTSKSFNGALLLKGTTGTITGTALSSTCDSGTVTVTGAVVGHTVAVSSTTGADVGGAFYLRGSVTAANTVTVYICGTGTPASLAYNVTIF